MIINDKKKLKTIILLLIFVILFGTIGFKFLLDVHIIDALYMTVITISTVGYTEVAEMTYYSKLFSIIIIFLGLLTAGYGITYIFGLFLEGTFKENWRIKQMNKKIENMKDHYILCGAGETGQSVIDQFIKSKIDFIVIEKNEKIVKELIENEIPVILGDGTQETFLEKAKIKDAKGFITSLSDDASNVFSVLTAREILILNIVKTKNKFYNIKLVFYF